MTAEAPPSRGGTDEGVNTPAESGRKGSRLSVSGRIAANSVVQILGSGLASFVSLFTIAAVTRALGPSSFGDYVAAAAFLGIPLLVGDLGMSWTVLREISKHPEKRERVMGVSIVVRSMAAAVILTVAVVIALLLPFNDQVHYAIAVGALGAFFNLADLSLMPVLQAELRMQWVVVVTIVSRLLTLGFVLALIALDYGFHEIVWAYVVGSAANFLLDVIVVRRLVGIRLIFDLRYGWSLLGGSIMVAIAYGMGMAYWYVDRVLLALLGSSKDVGLYGAAFKYVELSFIPISAISISIFPVLARSFAEDEGSRVPQLLQWSIDIMLLASVPVCAFAIAYSGGLIELVGGADFAPAAPALQVLGFLIVAVFVSSAFERALIAGNRERLLGALNGVILAVNIVLNVIFIPVYGYMAVAVVSLATTVVWILLAGFLTHRHFGFTPRFRFTGLVVVGGAAMTAILSVRAIPPAVACIAAVAIFVLVVTVPPGAGKEIAKRIFGEVRGLRAGSGGGVRRET